MHRVFSLSCGGPGPATLAYRRTLASINTVSPGPGISSRFIANRPAVKKPGSAPVSRSRRPNNKVVEPVVGTKSDLTDSRYATYRLRQVLRHDDHDKVPKRWTEMRELGHLDHLKETDYGPISSYIERWIKSKKAQAIFASPSYWIIREMAIEAAARDSWTGLHALSIAAIKAGRPQEAASAYEEYKTRIFAVQGKQRKVSSERRERDVAIANRLDGHGPKPLTYVYLLSMMLLEQIDAKVLLGVLETKVSIYTGSAKLVETLLAAVLPSFPSHRWAIIRRDYEQVIEKAHFTLQAWHPKAQSRWIEEYQSNEDWPALRTLYKRYLDWSIGPDKIIHPTMKYDRQTQDIPAVVWPLELWLHFIFSFQLAGDYDTLLDMIQKRMPERGLKPPAAVLARLIHAFAYINGRSDFPRSTRDGAGKAAEALWQSVRQEGIPLVDSVIAARIDTLAITGPYAVEHLHEDIECGAYPLAGRDTLSYLVGFYIRRGQPDKAVALIQAGISGKGICRPDRRVFSAAVRAARRVRSNGPTLMVDLLRLKPPDVLLTTSAVGHTLGHLLYWGHSVEDIISRFEATVVQHPKHNLVDPWMSCISAILHRDLVTPQSFAVAIGIASLLATKPPPNLTATTAHTRLLILDAALQSFPPKRNLDFNQTLYLSIIDYALQRPQRDRISDAFRIRDWFLDRHANSTIRCRWIMMDTLCVAAQNRDHGMARDMLHEPGLCDSNSNLARADIILGRLSRGLRLDGLVRHELQEAVFGRNASLPKDDEWEDARDLVDEEHEAFDVQEEEEDEPEYSSG